MRRPRRVHHPDGRETPIRWPRGLARTTRLARMGGRDTRVAGWFDRATGTISVSQAQSAPDQACTLAHELAHCFLPRAPHRIVEPLSEWLVKFTRRNKALALWFVEACCGPEDEA